MSDYMIIDFLIENSLPLILFALGIPLAIYINRRFFPKKKLGYRIKTERLFTKPNITDFEVQFKKKTVNNLFSTKILIINAGRGTIIKTDKPTEFPIIIRTKLKSDKILDYKISTENRISNGFAIKEDGSELALNFDYINPNDGCIISVLHTIESNLNENYQLDLDEYSDIFSVEGELIGIEKIEKLNTLIRSQNDAPLLFIVLFSMMGIVVWIAHSLNLDAGEDGPIGDKVIFLVAFLVSVVVALFLTVLVKNFYVNIIGKRTYRILEKF